MERFKRGLRKPIDIANLRAVEEGPLNGRMPYVYEASTQNVDTFAWLDTHRAAVDRMLIQHGAVLLRGFSLAEIPRFEALLQRMCGKIIADYGDLPEEKGTRNVYGSTPYPADRPILFHNESSHLQSWPTRQFFACVVASATGGETPLVDCRKVFERLDPTARERFTRLGLCYTRNFIAGLDVSWQQFFKTNDRAEVARACEAAATDYFWQDDGTLTIKRLAPAALRHPAAGTWSFFNQIMLHHPYFLGREECEALVTLYGEGRLPRTVTFGDGSALGDALLEEIRALYDSESVSFTWRPGDVVMLDNLSVAHGRNPFTGARKIIVGMGDPMEIDVSVTPQWRAASHS
jgi:alpha-ketoglutarate-dependent taurine dioxygenase